MQRFVNFLFLDIIFPLKGWFFHKQTSLRQTVVLRSPAGDSAAFDSLAPPRQATENALAAASTFRSTTPRNWPRPESNPRLAVLAIPMTTLWPRRSTDCTRPKSFENAAPGRISTKLSMQLWNGSTGLTIEDYWSRSGIFRRPSTSWCIISNWKIHPRRHDSHKTASGIPGAIHQDEQCLPVPESVYPDLATFARPVR